MRVSIYFVMLCWLSGCASVPPLKEKSHHGEIYSEAMGRKMAYSVYTPPEWTREEQLPLVVMLHGARDDHTTFDRYGVADYLDSLYAKNALPRAIVVNPDGGLGFWENWHDGSRHYRDWVVQDLMPLVAERYATLGCPEHCHVAGVSMGGHGAMRFGYYESDTFSSVAAISGRIISKQEVTQNSWQNFFVRLFIPVERIWGDIDGDSDHVPKDLDPYVSWVRTERMADIRLFLVWGDRDHRGIESSNEKFQAHLELHQRDHEYWEYDGEHRWVDWRSAIAEAIRFHVDGQAKASDKMSFAQKN